LQIDPKVQLYNQSEVSIHPNASHSMVGSHKEHEESDVVFTIGVSREIWRFHYEILEMQVHHLPTS